MTPRQTHADLRRAAPSADLRRLLALASDGRLSAYLDAIQALAKDRERLVADAADLDDLSDPRVWAARLAHLASLGAEATEETLLRFVRLAFAAGLIMGAIVGALFTAAILR